MTQVYQVAQPRTDAKICVSCEFLIFKGLVGKHKLFKCLLSDQVRNPNMHACSLHGRRNP